MATREPLSADLYDGIYDADTLRILGQAFDEAWASIAGNFGDSIQADAARATLADIVLSFPHHEIRDAQQIKDSSLQILALTYRRRAQRASASRDLPD